MGRFAEFVSGASAALPPMPLFHTCEGWDFRQILLQNRLEVTPCRHFGSQPLLYFFYGKPAYRSGNNQQATSSNAFMPVAIAVKSESQGPAERLAPFDTGAYFSDLYKPHLHPKMKCEDFLLHTDPTTPGRVVSRFFGTNRQYFHGVPTNETLPPLEFEAMSYQSLILERQLTDVDDRRSFVEVQFKSPVSLDNKEVLLVVLPGIFLDEPEIRSKVIDVWGARVKHYRIHHGRPGEYVADIYRQVEDYLTESSYI